jgi:hypothetical protein
MKDPTNDQSNEIRNETDPREPYDAPKLECEQLFEILALGCGKIQPVTFNCRTTNRRS